MTKRSTRSHLRLADDDGESQPSPMAPAERRRRDRERFARVQGGDGGAFADIFNDYQAPLCRYAEAIVHSRDIAFDVVSDVFQSLWLKRGQLEPVGLWPYLVTATRNRAFDVLDRQRVEAAAAMRLAASGVAPEMGSTGQIAPDEELLDREDALAVTAQMARLERAYAALPSRNRQVLELWAKGLTYKEIGRALGVAMKTVDSHLQQAKRTLRSLLEDR